MLRLSMLPNMELVLRNSNISTGRILLKDEENYLYVRTFVGNNGKLIHNSRYRLKTYFAHHDLSAFLLMFPLDILNYLYAFHLL